MQAKDIMTTDVVTADPDDDVGFAAGLLLDHHISAAPVVDRNGRLCGIVSEGDLMRRAEYGSARRWWLALLADKTAEFTRCLGTRVRDVMTNEIVSIGEDTPLSDVAHILEANAIKRVPVLREGRLVGVVSRADVLRGLAAARPRLEVSPGAEDQKIRTKIVELIRHRTSASLQAVSVIVVDGTVYLWGTAEDTEDKDAIRIAAENVAGVKKVHDFLNTVGGILRGVQ